MEEKNRLNRKFNCLGLLNKFLPYFLRAHTLKAKINFIVGSLSLLFSIDFFLKMQHYFCHSTIKCCDITDTPNSPVWHHRASSIIFVYSMNMNQGREFSDLCFQKKAISRESNSVWSCFRKTLGKASHYNAISQMSPSKFWFFCMPAYCFNFNLLHTELHEILASCRSSVSFYLEKNHLHKVSLVVNIKFTWIFLHVTTLTLILMAMEDAFLQGHILSLILIQNNASSNVLPLILISLIILLRQKMFHLTRQNLNIFILRQDVVFFRPNRIKKKAS